eukprot:11601027-Ditylum_brightwellii.AAC.1
MSKYFDDVNIFMIPGQMFPVDVYYTKSTKADYVDAAIDKMKLKLPLKLHTEKESNGIMN